MLNLIVKRGERSRVRELLGGYISDSPSSLGGKKGGSRREGELGHGSSFEQLARYAGFDRKRRSLYLGLAIAIGTLSVFLTFVTARLGWLLAGAIALFALRANIKRAMMRRSRAFERDYTALLVSLASSIKTGADPLQALVKAGNLFGKGSEVQRAVQRFGQDIEIGKSESVAVRDFAADIFNPDLQLFRNAFLLARKEGSSLAECLHRLARVTRHRQSFRRKVKAAIAMQKLSAIGIGGCAVIIALIQYSSNPEAVKEALSNPVGVRFLSLSGLLITSGIIWMLQLARPRV